jgi:hypothetical protein
MFGLFKKRMNRNALIFTFLQLVGDLIDKNGRDISISQIDNKFNEYLNYSKTKLSEDQLTSIKYASQIVCMNIELQEKILKLHHANESEVETKFLEVLDEFQSFGCFL